MRYRDKNGRDKARRAQDQPSNNEGSCACFIDAAVSDSKEIAIIGDDRVSCDKDDMEAGLQWQYETLDENTEGSACLPPSSPPQSNASCRGEGYMHQELHEATDAFPLCFTVLPTEENDVTVTDARAPICRAPIEMLSAMDPHLTGPSLTWDSDAVVLSSPGNTSAATPQRTGALLSKQDLFSGHSNVLSSSSSPVYIDMPELADSVTVKSDLPRPAVTRHARSIAISGYGEDDIENHPCGRTTGVHQHTPSYRRELLALDRPSIRPEMTELVHKPVYALELTPPSSSLSSSGETADSELGMWSRSGRKISSTMKAKVGSDRRATSQRMMVEKSLASGNSAQNSYDGNTSRMTTRKRGTPPASAESPRKKPKSKADQDSSPASPSSSSSSSSPPPPSSFEENGDEDEFVANAAVSNASSVVDDFGETPDEHSNHHGARKDMGQMARQSEDQSDKKEHLIRQKIIRGRAKSGAGRRRRKTENSADGSGEPNLGSSSSADLTIDYDMIQELRSYGYEIHGMLPGLYAVRARHYHEVAGPEVKRRKLKHANLYAPEFVRGLGPNREALCPLCPKEVWLKTKVSAYWYHLHFFHGVCSDGYQMDLPVRFRVMPVQTAENTTAKLLQGLCGHCEHWIDITDVDQRLKVPELSWWKHIRICSEDKGNAKPRVNVADEACGKPYDEDKGPSGSSVAETETQSHQRELDFTKKLENSLGSP